MKIEHAIKLMSRLPIRHRDSGLAVPFKLNPNQVIAAKMMMEQEAKGLPLRVVCLKSRRVGMSSLIDGLGLCHVISQPLSIGRIVAHLDKSVEALFRIPKGLVQGMQQNISSGLFKPPTQEKIIAIHPEGDSELSISTAGSTQGGRGDAFSFLHLSEAGYYAGEGSFTSLLNAVPDDPSTIVCIESTANGKVGIGESFYRYWKDAESGRNTYIPIFLSWLDDPACVRNPDEAKDAPIDQEERDLIKFFNASKAQLAWRRWCIYNRCGGYLETFFVEYPANPEEAFVATGNPAFIKEELTAARASVRDGVSIHWARTESKKIEFQPGGNGSLIFFKRPEEGHSYRVGVDAARGEELTSDGKSKSAGDFAAATVIDASTMEVVARFADRVSPSIFGELLNTLGRYYNNAMMCIELTGGWGAWVQTVLRDTFNYPFFYMWKGFDDKARAPKAARNQMGWKTTVSSREKLFTAFREALREQDLQVRDVQCVTQMEQAERVTGRWEVKKGHDDVMFCFPKGTQIATSDGQAPIEVLQRGDKVLTHTGTYQEVLGVDAHPATELCHVKVLGSYRSVPATCNHPFYVSRYEWRKRKSKTRKKLLMCPPEWKAADELTVGDSLLVPKRKRLPKSRLPEDMLWLMGWYLAEGWADKERGVVTFCLNSKEEEIAEQLASILVKYDKAKDNSSRNHIYKRYAPAIRKIKGANAISLRYSSSFWAELFATYCGIGSEHKQLAPEVFGTSGLMPLIRGYFEGDGCQSKASSRDHLFLSSKSEVLIWQVRQILVDEGIWCTVCRPTSQDICILHVTPENFSKFGESFKIKEVPRKFHKRHVVETAEGFWTPIKSIERTPFVGNVFNLEVAEDKTFVAEGVAVHNSSLLANIAVQHYPASRLFGKPKNTAEDDTEEQLKSVVNWKPGHEVPPDGKGVFLHEMLAKHVKELELGSKLKGRVQPLQGI